MATANHVLLRRITLTASASSVTFDSIPQTGYTDLKIVASVRDGNTGVRNWAQTRFNNNSSAVYNEKLLYTSNGTSAASANNPNGTELSWMGINANSSTSNTFNNAEMYITNYTSSAYKSGYIDYVSENNGTEAGLGMNAFSFNSTSAISSIVISSPSNSFLAGSSFSLYGIANAATTPVSAPKADGGDIIKTDGTYWYHAFTGSGVFKPQLNLTADVLVVAGGGGAQYTNRFGGGGGAGGLLAFTSESLTASNYTVTVGAGGPRSTTLASCKGGNSSFGALTVAIGGGGGAMGGTAGADGGSGGGAGLDSGTGGAGTSGQGYAGGIGTTSSGRRTGGGGGGAGGAGANANTVYGGDGGVGVTSSLINSIGSATGLGQLVSSNYYFAGGGGGSAYEYQDSVVDGGSGGNGGGGKGAFYRDGDSPVSTHSAIAGTAGTGGGGGGDAWDGYANGAAGGSGVVIIRYPVA